MGQHEEEEEEGTLLHHSNRDAPEQLFDTLLPMELM